MFLFWELGAVASNIEHPLRRIIFIQGKRTQQSMRTLLHGMETQSHTANQIEWCIFTLCALLRFVIASATEVELVALFLNCKQAKHL
jgi:hypothetical protein